LARATVSYDRGQFEIAFGASPVVSTARNALAVATTAPSNVSVPLAGVARLSREEILQLVAQAVAASESRQQEETQGLLQAASKQADEQRLRDRRELAEGLRYFEAAQVTMWKEQVQNQQYVSALMQQAGLEILPRR
jgi:glycine/D-amino acid oxidase-like deaminating enzyme